MATYITSSALKSTLNIGSTYADTDVADAIEAASRAIDAYMNYPPNFFTANAAMTRYYSPQACDTELDIDPLNTLTSVTIDTDGDGTYDTTWTVGTHFILAPANAATDSVPYTKLVILPQSGRSFSGYLNGVRVVGSFGWASTPGQVKQAATLLAGRLLKRARETPYGMVVVAGDTIGAARLGKIDPDVAMLLSNLHGTVPLLAI